MSKTSLRIREQQELLRNGPLQLDHIVSVYSGIDGKCCCGCSGNHLYARKYAEEGGKQRGYPVDEEDINDAMVKKVALILARAKSEELEVENSYVSTVIGKRIYIAYPLRSMCEKCKKMTQDRDSIDPDLCVCKE